MPHYTQLFSNMIICEIRDVEFGEVTAQNQGMPQVASHPHNCPSDPQKGKKGEVPHFGPSDLLYSPSFICSTLKDI